jgi:mRNA-degrading endonuclease RelE of RelBE toxin-antitoxin system
MFNSGYSDELKNTLKKLYNKDRNRYESVIKKIEEIISQDPVTIMHYKNLRYDLSDQKRVHIGEKFVLTFQVFLKENYILFIKFKHRDEVYK